MVTLRQLTEKLANGDVCITTVEGNEETISAGEFESLQSFFSYYDTHYKPILEELKKSWSGNPVGAKRFFADDMLAFFG